LAILDVDIDITIGDFESVDDLADVEMSNTSVGILVRIITNGV
jgi:hypothetical protein